MKYNVKDIVDENITDIKLKEIINQKLYKIIDFIEYNE